MKGGDTGGTGLSYKPGHLKDVNVYLDPVALLQPLRWRRGRKIFPLSMSDLFGDWVPDEWIDKIFAVMALSPQHTFQVLTKRPKRMREYMLERWQGTPAHPEMGIPAGGETGRRSKVWAAAEEILESLGLTDPDKEKLWDENGSLKASQFDWPLPNVWLGTSICDQANAEDFVFELLGAPAALHFVSAAPLLGQINLRRLAVKGGGWYDALAGFRDVKESPAPEGTIGWVLTEGESGKEARETIPDWFRMLRDQCAATGAKFHHKQNGEFLHGKRVGLKKAGRLLDGVEHNEFPT